MRAAAGASRDRNGAAGLALVLFLAGLTVTGMLFLPSLVSRTTLRNNTTEEAALVRLEEGFRDYVRLYQMIPGTDTWATAVSLTSGLNVTQVNCVFPDFPADTTVQRVFVVDEILGGASPVLPYTQSTNGLTGAATNLLNSRARAMIVSSTKRGLALPVSSGFLTQANFDAIWNWTYNPVTKAPPSGWSSAWTGNGEFLHVKPIFLPDLFSKITLLNTRHNIGFLNVPAIAVTVATDFHFLNGTPLVLATTAGILRDHHVVRRDSVFSYGTSSPTNALPLVWFQFEESSGSYATNSGSLGTAASGYMPGTPNYRQDGPRPPSFPGFRSSNYGIRFNKDYEYISTTSSVASGRRAFTLAGWVYVRDIDDERSGLFGQKDAIEIGFITEDDVQVWTPWGGDITVSWPYSEREWHHIAATGDGTTLRLYFDGTEVGNVSRSTSNYGTSTYPFCVGGSVVFDPPDTGPEIDAAFDDVMFFDRALSAGDVRTLATGSLP